MSRAAPAYGTDDRMDRSWAAVLAEVPLFRRLRPRQIRSVAKLGRPKRSPAQTTLVREAEPGDAFYLVLDGWVTVRRRSRPAIELGPGEFFGELALLADLPRTATVVAESDVLLMKITQRDFQKLLRVDPEIARALLVGLAARLSSLQTIAT
jgi:CRP-like cAMP-binding protein